MGTAAARQVLTVPMKLRWQDRHESLIVDQRCRGLRERSDPATGIADRNVEPTPPLDDRGDSAVHRVRIGDVDLKSDRLSTARLDLDGSRVVRHRFAFRGEVFVRPQIEIQHGYSGTQRGKSVRVGSPKPTSRSGDQRYCPLSFGCLPGSSMFNTS